MRYLSLLLTAFLLAACGTAPVTRETSRPAGPAETSAAAPRSAPVDSALQFLLTASAADFHKHSPPYPARFRDVRLGRFTAAGGDEQYMLCGEFLPAKEGGNAEWIPFVTIKTSGYEQMIGPQSANLCRNSSVIWDKLEDLSSALQSRLDSLR